MKKHSGMRPHDIPILLKIVCKRDKSWMMKDLANELRISASEISESLNRSVIAGLLSSDKKKVNRLALLDFLEHGLKYIYPQRPGALSRGIPTAHSAPPLNNHISGDENFVWAYAKGDSRGQIIEPLHPNIPEACMNDREFYEMMALVDSIRSGRARERNIAVEILETRLKNG